MRASRLSAAVLLLGWLFSPALFSQISILGELTHEKQASSGETYTGTITVQNSGDSPKNVRIYQTDFAFRSDGSNFYGDPGKLPRSNANWIVYSPKQVTIQGGEKINVDFTLKVPNDSTLTGTYWSMIMVEGIPEISVEKPTQNIGITVVTRYAIQIVTNIEDTGSRKMKFFAPVLVKEEGKALFQIDMENVGERWLRPDVWIELYTLEGKSAGTYKGSKARIYPGTSSRVKMDVSQVILGTYKALVVADCGGEDLFGANYTVKIQ